MQKENWRKKIAEKVIEDATGGKVDIHKDTATIKTEHGETKVGENQKWPKDKMGDLPELKTNITMVIEDYDKEKDINLGMVYFSDLKKNDAEKYVEAIKNLKYESVLESSSGDGFMYSGKNEKGAEVVFFPIWKMALEPFLIQIVNLCLLKTPIIIPPQEIL